MRTSSGWSRSVLSVFYGAFTPSTRVVSINEVGFLFRVGFWTATPRARDVSSDVPDGRRDPHTPPRGRRHDGLHGGRGRSRTLLRAVKEGDKHAMKTLEARLTRQLNEFVAMVRQDLNKINRKKVNTLLIIDVHSRDIVDSFIERVS